MVEVRPWRVTVTVVVAVTALASQCVLAQINHDLFEGDACKLPNGARGICQRPKNCPGFRQQIRGQRPQVNPPICSFIGTGPRSEPIICCGKAGQPLVATNTPRTPPNVASRMGGEKARKACEDYKRSKVQSHSVIPLILAGEDTAVGEFPHMALLGYSPRGGSQISWACGGAIISDRYVLTAAHCLRGKDGPPVRVRLGEHDVGENNDKAQDYGVEAVILNPQFGSTNVRSWYHDIGLIRLNRKVEFSPLIFPACLYSQPEDVVKDLIITGWGATTSTGGGSSLSNVLQKGKGTLVLVPARECNTFYPIRQLGQRLANGIQQGMFCATDPNGEVDTCQGDSGGPIQIAMAVDKDVYMYQIVGVTCSGPSICGESPAIYTRVFFYLDWIEGIVWP